MARKEVVRSALTLRGLCHGPTGSILAAATMSLPEELGGVRNWDYRYCWLRDAAMSARVLVDLGSLGEAEAFLHWVDGCIARTGGHPERLHPLYTIEGLELGPEAVIETLPGYAGSRPVRVGNAANRQIQLDVFGPIADLVAAVVGCAWLGAGRALARRRGDGAGGRAPLARARPRHLGGPAAAAPPRLLQGDVLAHRRPRARGAGAARRGAPAGLGRAARIDPARTCSSTAGTRQPAPTRSPTATRRSTPRRCGSASRASLADDDPRFLATVLKIEAELRSGAVVYRYRWDDGLPGTEGGFHICTAWLIEAYLRTGRRGDAEELFQQMLETAGPTGLLPEQYDPFAERGLGNHPQAYSHLGLIRCAAVLSAAARASGRGLRRDFAGTELDGLLGGRGSMPALRASPHLDGALVAVALDLPLELVEQLVDRSLVGRRRLARDEVRALGVDDRLDRVVVGDRRVVLARERDLDQRQVVEAAIELRQLRLRVLPRGLARVVVTGGELRVAWRSSISLRRIVSTLHPTTALPAPNTRRRPAAPARRSSVAHAVAVEPVV